MPWWASLIKATPALGLFARALVRARGSGQAWRYCVAFGFLASAAGDFALGVDRRGQFVTGLLFFLGAHLLFSLAIWRRGDLRLRRWQPGLIGIPVLTVFTWIAPALGSLFVPVAMYALAIGVMGTLAWSHVGRGFASLRMGAALFILSDSLIALDKFHAPLHGRGAWVLLTYYAALYFLGRGFKPDSEDVRA